MEAENQSPRLGFQDRVVARTKTMEQLKPFSLRLGLNMTIIFKVKDHAMAMNHKMGHIGFGNMIAKI